MQPLWFQDRMNPGRQIVCSYILCSLVPCAFFVHAGDEATGGHVVMPNCSLHSEKMKVVCTLEKKWPVSG